MGKTLSISELLGKTLVSVRGAVGDDEVYFETSDGETFKLYHENDCCEHVELNDISGDLQDLVGHPITMAEEVSNGPVDESLEKNEESFTWTFYKLATIKGYVDLRWFGSSNGYYSEDVSFTKVF